MENLLYKLNKTDDDIELLLAQHKNLVYHMLTTMGQLNNQEAESAAWDALWMSVGTFDVFSTNEFSTYACVLIRNSINDVLRKQQLEYTHKCSMLQLADNNSLIYDMSVDNAELVAFIDLHFSNYIKTKSGITKNILLAWYSSGFLLNVTNISKMCNCSVSYASRVQNVFRAFISGKLKEF